MLDNDRIIAVDSTPITKYSEFQSVMRNRPNQVVTITVERGGKQMPLTMKTNKFSKIGVIANDSVLKVHKSYSFGEAIPSGISAAFEPSQYHPSSAATRK